MNKRSRPPLRGRWLLLLYKRISKNRYPHRSPFAHKKSKNDSEGEDCRFCDCVDEDVKKREKNTPMSNMQYIGRGAKKGEKPPQLQTYYSTARAIGCWEKVSVVIRKVESLVIAPKKKRQPRESCRFVLVLHQAFGKRGEKPALQVSIAER